MLISPEKFFESIYNVHDVSGIRINDIGNLEFEISGIDPFFQLKNIIH